MTGDEENAVFRGKTADMKVKHGNGNRGKGNGIEKEQREGERGEEKRESRAPGSAEDFWVLLRVPGTPWFLLFLLFAAVLETLLGFHDFLFLRGRGGIVALGGHHVKYVVLDFVLILEDAHHGASHMFMGTFVGEHVEVVGGVFLYIQCVGENLFFCEL